MRRIEDVRLMSQPVRRSRTVTLNGEGLGRSISFGAHVRNIMAAIEGWTPGWIKRLGRWFAQPKVALPIAVITVAIIAVGAYYYTRLASEIDQRLRGGFFDNSVGIFSSPFKVSVGDRLTMSELAGYLRAAGYQERQDRDEARSSFFVSGDTIEIIPGKEASRSFDLNPVRLKLDGNGRIASINSLTNGSRLDSTAIEGELLATVRNGDRHKKITVAFADIPETLRNAILAAEDRRFFSHSGIDWRGIARALWADVHEGGVVQGGSTITQQLIKNAFLTSERTLSRKVKEAAMAVILESRLSKEEIFALYCNNVYLGQAGSYAIHGFAEAAQVYFGKTLDKLTLSESAFLAGLVHAPNRYTSRDDQARSVERRNIILNAMAETGAVAPGEAEAAGREPLELKKRESTNDLGTSYFVDYVQRFIDQRYGEKGTGTRQRVNTSMDPRLQRAAYEAVTSHTEKLDRILKGLAGKKGDPARVQAALVALDAHTGEILAMIGGRDYGESQLNRATDAKRQPGSTFKPFVYAGALSARSYTAASLLSDRPQAFAYDGGREVYKPSNYHGGYSNRDVTLREALARSLNVPTVDLAMRVGLGRIAALAEECGIDRPRAYPSMALGTSEVTPLELAGAYTAFANDGKALRPIPVRAVASEGSFGLTEKVSTSSSQVFSPQVAYLMTNLMQSVVDSGTASSLRAMGLRGAIAGKTGTSNDGWFVGYTPNLVCVVWVGFDDNRDIHMKASDAALPIWADFMKEALEIHPEYGKDSFARPSGIIAVEIDPTTGLAAGPDCAEHKQEIFISGTEPYATCSHYNYDDVAIAPGLDDPSSSYDSSYSTSTGSPRARVSVDVCADSGLLASPTCRSAVRKTFDIGKEPLTYCMGEGRAEPDENWHAAGNLKLEDKAARRRYESEGLNRPRDVRRAKRGLVY
jgi:penicillin-binding protein 1B